MRLSRWRLWLLLLSLLVLTGPVLAQQDTWTGVERIVAVGDVHGDYGQFVKVLRAAEVIDDKTDWIAGKTHLVQTGDVLDRGGGSRKAMDLLMKLETQAAKAGGAVHALIGNHEAMVLLGDWRYVTAAEVKAFGGAQQYRQAMGPDGQYGKWIRGHNAVIKINDLLFCHAGISSTFAGVSLGKINATIRQELQDGRKDGLAMDDAGPLWDRSLPEGDPAELPKLPATLKTYGVSRMIVGHTVSRSGVAVKAGGRLIMIDVGMTKYYGGPAAGLLVEKDKFYQVTPGGRKPLPGAPASQPAAGTPKRDRPPTSRPASAPVREAASRRWRGVNVAAQSAGTASGPMHWENEAPSPCIPIPRGVIVV